MPFPTLVRKDEGMSLIETVCLIEFLGWVAMMYVARDSHLSRTTISLAFVSAFAGFIGVYSALFTPLGIEKFDLTLLACINLILALSIAVVSATRDLSLGSRSTRDR